MNKLYLFFLVILFLFLYLLTWSPFFEIKDIEIISTQLIPQNSVEAVVISKDYFPNLFHVKTHKAKDAILVSLNQVESVRIIRDFSEKKIIIKPKERKPFLKVINYPYTYFLDKKGYVINYDSYNQMLIEIEKDIDIPLVTGISSEHLENRFKISDSFMGVVTKVMPIFLKTFGNNGVKFDVRDQNNMNFVTKEMIEIKFGDINNIKTKIQVIDTLYSYLSEKLADVVYIDVTVPSHPVVKFVAQ